MFRTIVPVLALTLAPLPSLAERPPLSHSQQSYASACLDWDDSLDRLIAFCELALTEPGASPSQRVALMTNLGDALMESAEFDRAVEAYSEALALNPGHANAHSGLGWVAHERDAYPDAIAHFEDALEHGQTAQAVAGLASAQFKGGMIDLDTAAEQLDLAAALDSDYAWPLRQKGWFLLDANRPEAAETAFHQALDITGSNLNGYIGLSRSLRDQDNLNAALVPLMKAIVDYPDATTLYSDRAYLYWLMDWNKMALRDADRVIADRPKSSSGYVHRARALSDLGRRAEAFETFARGEEETGFSAYLLYHYALYLTYDARFEEAWTKLKRVMEEGEPDDYDLRLAAEIHLELGQYEAAATIVDRALELASERPDGYLISAQIRAAQGAIPEALERFDLALERGLDWSRYTDLTVILAEQGATKEVLDLQKRYRAWRATKGG